MELTSQELAELYAQIENKSDKEIEVNINLEIFRSKSTRGSERVPMAKYIPSIIEDSPISGQLSLPSRKLFEICKKYAAKNSAKIKAILKNNPKSTNYALNVIQLLVPAIAQQYSGIPAMAIVGSITLLCRQGIENFIK